MSVGGISTNVALNAVNYAQGTAMEGIGTAVLSKALDQQEIAGNGLQKMMEAAEMERSVNPAIGSNFDMSV